jgi:hypothetical protein
LVATMAGIVWYENEMAARSSQESRRHAETERRRSQAERAIRLALDDAASSRTQLHNALRKRDGVFELLKEPSRWQLHVQTAQAALDRAKAYAASAEEGLDSQLQQMVGAIEESRLFRS